MASDLLNLGAQSVLTAQKQLNTTGHNISNVNTKGYSRQSVIQGVNTPRQYGGQTFGMGVHVENVRRSWDKFAVKELNIATTDFSKKQDIEKNLDTLSSLLSSATSRKIPENINDWFDALKTFADTPNDVGTRKVVLEKANLIGQNMNDFYDTVRQQYDDVNEGLELGIKRVNQLALEIRDLQRLMMKTPGPHNDLMDEHEKLIRELSQYTKVTVTPRKNREGYNVIIGNGSTLVSGTEASQLKMVAGDPDTHQLRLAMVEGKGIKTITAKDIGGKLAALYDMRDNQIPHVLDEIGRLATSFSYQVNQLQSQGLDLNGNVGQNLFTDVNSDAITKSRVITASQSQADMKVYIEDISQLKGGEYSLQYDGSNYVTTLPSGEQKILSPENNAIVIDGIRIQINQPPEKGERVLIRPTRTAAREFRVQFNDPTKIAAQSYEASTSFALGTAKFDILSAGNLREFSININATGDKFSVLDKNGNVVLNDADYPPVGPVEVMGTTFKLSSGALPKDKFAANLVPSEGDNGNVRKLQNMQIDKLVNGNESTLLDVYQDLNTDVGLRTATASRLSDVAHLEKQSAEERVAAISGVNLDEEAANMMKFQQAYMASSRIMQTANDTFNTILALK